MNYLDNNFIYVLLVVFDMDSLNKSRLLDLHKIQWCKSFLFRLTWEYLDPLNGCGVFF